MLLSSTLPTNCGGYCGYCLTLICSISQGRNSSIFKGTAGRPNKHKGVSMPYNFFLFTFVCFLNGVCLLGCRYCRGRAVRRWRHGSFYFQVHCKAGRRRRGCCGVQTGHWRADAAAPVIRRVSFLYLSPDLNATLASWLCFLRTQTRLLFDKVLCRCKGNPCFFPRTHIRQ